MQESSHSILTIEENNRPIARVTSVQQANANFNDEDIDFDQLAAIEAEFSNESSKRLSDDAPLNPQKKFKLDTSIAQNTSNDYPDDNDVFFQEDEDYLRELEEKFDATLDQKIVKYPIKVSTEPYVYIKQIKSLKTEDTIGKSFRIKGQILKLLSKLSVGKDGWTLRCTLVDGTGALDVDFTSDVLSKLVGYTPTEMNKLKKEMAIKPELKQLAVTVSCFFIAEPIM